MQMTVWESWQVQQALAALWRGHSEAHLQEAHYCSMIYLGWCEVEWGED